MKKKYLIILSELLLLNLFIFNLAAGTISNFSGNVFSLKAVSSVLLIGAAAFNFILYSKKGTNNCHSDLASPAGRRSEESQTDQGVDSSLHSVPLRMTITEFWTGVKKLSVILFLFILYLSLTLLYSGNPAYGFQKILNFLISIIPSIFVFYYMVSTLTELRKKVFLYSISVIAVFSVTYIVIYYPFDQSTVYEYRAGRWSHVIYGRMISSIAVILFLYILTLTDKVRILLLSFLTAIAVYGTYLSALRSAFLGLMIFGSWFLVLSAWLAVREYRNNNLLNIKTNARNSNSYPQQLIPDYQLPTQNFEPRTTNYELRTRTLYPVLLTIILSALLILFIPKRDIIEYRFENLMAIENLEFKNDPAIHSRLDAYQLSLKIIKENPLIGTGLGGFRGYNNIEWTKAIKYPHNIILEILSETGVVGLLVLGSLFFVIFKYAFKYSYISFYFLLFAFFLAMFSKDISTQPYLWIGLAFITLKK